MQRPQGGQRGKHRDRRQTRFGDLTSGTELGDRVSPRRSTQLDSGDGKTERLLLGWLESQLGKVVALRIDAVAELLLTCERLDAYRDPELAKRPFVPLKGLPARLFALWVADHARGNLTQGQWPCRLEQHEDQVRHPLEPVRSCGGSHLLHRRPRPPENYRPTSRPAARIATMASVNRSRACTKWTARGDQKLSKPCWAKGNSL